MPIHYFVFHQPIQDKKVEQKTSDWKSALDWNPQEQAHQKTRAIKLMNLREKILPRHVPLYLIYLWELIQNEMKQQKEVKQSKPKKGIEFNHYFIEWCSHKAKKMHAAFQMTLSTRNLSYFDYPLKYVMCKDYYAGDCDNSTELETNQLLKCINENSTQNQNKSSMTVSITALSNSW